MVKPDPAKVAGQAAVRSLVSGMKWNRAPFGVSSSTETGSKPPGLEWTLANLDCIKKGVGDKPMLLFIESKEYIKSTTRSKKKRAPKPTTQFKNSIRVDTAAFKHDKYKLPITTGIFTCFRMDVTSVTAETNKVLNSAKAPMVAVFAKDGTLKGVYKGGGASLNSIYGCMRKLMKPQGVNLDKMYMDIFSLLDNLYRNEVKLYKVKVKFGQDRAKYNKLKSKTAGAKARLAKAEKGLKDCQGVSNKIRERCKAIIKEYELKMKETVAAK